MIGYGKKTGSSTRGLQNWRELRFAGQRRIKTRQARKRSCFKFGKALLISSVLVVLVSGVAWSVYALKKREKSIQFVPPSDSIERVIFNTNGVLPDSWLASTLQLRQGMKMMEIDIHALKDFLEADGQVKQASVERVFPSDLHIEIIEHEPVMQMKTLRDDGSIEILIVAREGSVYKGIGYPNNTLNSLPYLEPYRNPTGSVLPMHGIERIAEFLELARRDYPEVFGSWKIISLEHYSGEIELPGQVIELHSNNGLKVVFNAADDLGRQLSRLRRIMDYVKVHDNPMIDHVDLALSDSVAVRFRRDRRGTVH